MATEKGKSVREKLAKIQDDIYDLQPMTFIFVNFTIWAVLNVANIYFKLFGTFKTKKFDRGIADSWYRATAFTFMIACAFAYLGYVGTKSTGKKKIIMGMFLINFVVGFTWFQQALRATVTLVDHGGHPLDISRWIEWNHDMPALAYLIGRITRADPKETWGAISTSYWLTIFGFLSAAARHPYHELFATISMVFFMFTCGNFEKMFQPAIDGETGSKLEPGVLKSLKYITLSSWWGITIFWYIQKRQVVEVVERIETKCHIVSFATGEALICLGEVVAKIVFMLVIVNNTMDQSQSEQVSIAESIANELEREVAEGDKLLSKMIPQSVLDHLKSGRATGTEEYSCVTIFFSDIANFTVISSRTSTQDMLATLNKMWVQYDAISKRHGMYKVETIGDAFLGVVGAPDRVTDHAERAANFSLDIMAMIKDFKTVTGESIQIRAGLASGPVTGGILGESNPHWCIVGDTVNVASKMESTSKPMMVHISELTHELLKPCSQFTFAEADPVTMKGKTIKTYFVTGRTV
ncbi:Receptor-type guanylate cyclase gcy-22 [Phlyctochytrium planicorne]|nr:Receptor-type guanylate cyclase gcy-22 [Phlyctochytrium planicorne]